MAEVVLVLQIDVCVMCSKEAECRLFVHLDLPWGSGLVTFDMWVVPPSLECSLSVYFNEGGLRGSYGALERSTLCCFVDVVMLGFSRIVTTFSLSFMTDWFSSFFMDKGPWVLLFL